MNDEVPVGATGSRSNSRSNSNSSRVFVVCGRSRKVEELKALFSSCGTIHTAHLALDRSNKSRGFAFVQFEQEEAAQTAIQRFDQKKLPDGHVLKVSFAREKQQQQQHPPPPLPLPQQQQSPSASSLSSVNSWSHKGKLKRHQMSSSADQEDVGGGSHGGNRSGLRHVRDELTMAYSSQVPGKRHRSSWSSTSSLSSSSSPFVPKQTGRIAGSQSHPPHKKLVAASCSSSSSSSSRRNELMHTFVGAAASSSAAATVNSMPASAPMNGSGSFAIGKNNRRWTSPPVASHRVMASIAPQNTDPLHDIRQLLDDSVAVIEQLASRDEHDQEEESRHGPNVTRLLQLYHARQTNQQSILVKRESLNEDSLMTRIDSVSLVETTGHGQRRRLTSVPRVPPKPTTMASTIPTTRAKLSKHVPNEFGARKRSYDANESEGTKRTLNLPVETVFDTTTRAVVRERDSGTTVNTKKKHCTKQVATGAACSSALTASSSTLSCPQQGPREEDSFHQSNSSDKGYKLFVVSTLKFTPQELEAMFSVYGDFEAIEMVRSFGKIKTMAYVAYRTLATANAVIQSFEEENPEFIKVSLADTGVESTCLELKSTLSISSQDEHYPIESPQPSSKMGRKLYPRHHLPLRPPPSPHQPIALADHPPQQHEQQVRMYQRNRNAEKPRPWLLLEYDKSVAPDVISQTVAQFTGMEYVDIKMSSCSAPDVDNHERSSDTSDPMPSESTGIAYVKFASESFAWEAAKRLHQREIPVQSGKFMKAFVIADPAAGPMRTNRRAHADELELRTVETQFAYLMRGENGQLVDSSSMSPYHAPYDSSTQPIPAPPPLPPAMTRHASDPMQISLPAASFPPPPPMESLYPGLYPPLNPNQCYYYGLPDAMPPASSSSPSSRYSPYYGSYRNSTSAENAIESFAMGERNGGFNEAMEPSESTGECTNSDASVASALRPCVHVSCAQPLTLTSLVEVFEEVQGVVGFKLGGEDHDDHHEDDEAEADFRTQYVVKFAQPAQAIAAAKRLDGSLCNGQRIRVVATLDESSSSRRKRQRVDPRARR